MEATAAWRDLQRAIGTPDETLRRAILNRLTDTAGHVFWVGMMVEDPARAVEAIDELGEILARHGRHDTLPAAAYLRAACVAMDARLHQTLDPMQPTDYWAVKEHLLESRSRLQARVSAALWA